MGLKYVFSCEKIKEEGVYCFGGKQGNEKIRNRLMVLKCGKVK